ncbi:hypothetical protein [uncultured Microscilla sp.]|uniref:hypothetical protein n=1 Tax=uncultured Microscilla sp. TaxID=432653 RepID=UPI002612CFEA|nr:hypothetical protein [uncultured Microscilla sp.]
MHSFKKIACCLSIALILLSSCKKNDDSNTSPSTSTNGYNGTGSVTQGLANTTNSNLFAQGQRVAGVGTITSTDNTAWTVPANVNYTDASFPTASDLYNPYGNKYNTSTEAVNALTGTSDIIEIDANGEIVTGFIFADNYFELYINGVKVGKDAVPFTEFNSHIVRFKVSKPYTIAMKLVDWEENLGIGTEKQAIDHHPGDGGMIAVFKNANNQIEAITDASWKAQTFYTTPILDLSCLSEDGQQRVSTNCSEPTASTTASAVYAVHWTIPTDWAAKGYDDTAWPAATTYTAAAIGMDNKVPYTNFSDVFDDATQNAQFIWSTNIVLDNVVIVRKTVE